MTFGDTDGQNEEEMGFLQNEKPPIASICKIGKEMPLLNREDLNTLEIKEPVWRRARIGLLVVFLVLWIGLLAASVLIIVFTPKCPPRPTLNFWQQQVGYWVDPFAFKDTDGDNIGDFKGVVERLDYITDEVGARFIILDSFLSGVYSNTMNKLGLTNSFTDVDSALGSMDDFRTLVKTYRRSGVDVVITLDFNAVSTSHPWAKNASYISKYSASDKKVSRSGDSPSVQINGQSCYSVGDKDMVDIDMKNPYVLDELKKVVEFWLAEGISGILLKNAAFYIETNDIAESSSYVTNSSNAWFESYPNSQVFVNESVSVVQTIRQVIDSHAISGAKSKVLLVDAGDTGYGLRNIPDDALMFLGTEDMPGAHMIVSREFVRNRGWKAVVDHESWMISSIPSYDMTSSHNKSSLLLATATSSDRVQSDLISFALTFLLPGTPVVYYGAELNSELAPSTTPPAEVYPMGKQPFPNLDNLDSIVCCHLPMPWDQSGAGFSSAGGNQTYTTYLTDFDIRETVQSVLSIGRGPNAFQLMKKLIKLREEPSLLWGEFRRIFTNDKTAYGSEVFVREAEGFPAFIIAFIRTPSENVRVYDFSDVCPEFRARLIYPPKSTFPLDEVVSSNRIYVDVIDSQPSIYVFQCT